MIEKVKTDKELIALVKAWHRAEVKLNNYFFPQTCLLVHHHRINRDTLKYALFKYRKMTWKVAGQETSIILRILRTEGGIDQVERCLRGEINVRTLRVYGIKKQVYPDASGWDERRKARVEIFSGMRRLIIILGCDYSYAMATAEEAVEHACSLKEERRAA